MSETIGRSSSRGRWGSVDWPGFILFLALAAAIIYYLIFNPFEGLAPAKVAEPAAVEAPVADAPAPAVAAVEAVAAPEVRAPEPVVAAEPAAPEPELAATSEGGDGGAAASGIISRVLPSGAEMSVAAGGVEDKLIGFISDETAEISKAVWFDFDRLNFETGSAALTADSMDQVGNIQAILEAYPAVNLKIGGYTDNKGSEQANMRISQARADAVVAALVERGVDPARLEAEGYGPQHAVASNDTAEGRARNRRIAVSVRAK